MPAQWTDPLAEDFHGRVRFIRSFGRPSGLEPDTRVQLIITNSHLAAEVFLNSEMIGRMPTKTNEFTVDITQKLASRNRLVIEVDIPSGWCLANHLPESEPANVDVRLEIHELASS
jgi:hypothetical protein